MLPLRAPEDVFAVTEKSTVPFPEPELPEVMVIQFTLLEAVQLQALDAATPTLPFPALLVKDWLDGVSV